MSHMSFELLATDGKARRGRLTFPRGVVETPAFMPVGTYGTVKGMLPRDIEAIGAQIILGNTFHLWLRPGTEVIRRHGDLHRLLRPHEHLGAIHRRGEIHALLLDLAQRPQAEHLKAAGIGEDRSVPRHEPMQSPELAHEVGSGPQQEVVGVPQEDLGPGLAHVVGAQALDRALGADRHEGRRIHHTVRRREPAPAGRAVGGEELEAERAHVIRLASPYE